MPIQRGRGSRGETPRQHRDRRSAPGLLVLRALALPAIALLVLRPPGLQGRQTQSQPDPAPGPIVLELTASTRAFALGGAFWTAGDGSHAILHHPALISGEGFSVSRQRLGGTTHISMSGSGSWMGGTVSAGVSFLEYGTVADSPLELPREAAELIGGGDMAASEYTASVGFANEMFGVGVGAAAKMIGLRLGGLGGRTMAVDVGVSREIGPVSAALTVQNLGPGLKVGRDEVPLARRMIVGAGTGRRPLGPFDIGGAVQIAREGDGDVVPGGGLEIAWWPVQRRVFIVRIGAVRVVEGDSSPLTFGAGFEGDRIRIDYAYRDFAHEDLRVASHRIAIAIR